MKVPILLLLISFSFAGLSQKPFVPIDSVTGKITYKEVIQIDSVTKNEAYNAAKVWIAKTFRSAKDVIQNDDKDAGIIVLKPLFQLFATEKGYIHYTLTLLFKDGRYKYELSDFYHTGGNENGTQKTDLGACEGMLGIKEMQLNLLELHSNMIDIVKSLKTEMVPKKIKSDW